MYSFISRSVCRVRQKYNTRNCVMTNGPAMHVKTIEDMASPKCLPMLGTKLDLMLAGGGTKLHEYIDRRHEALGPIFYEKLGCDTKLVFVSDPVLIKRVFLSLEGKYPIHMLPDPWVLYEKLYGSKRGLFFMNSEEWLIYRRIMNNHLLREGSIEWMQGPVKDTVAKFVRYWKESVDKGNIKVNLESDLYRLSTEVILSILVSANSAYNDGDTQHFEEMISNLSETTKKIFQTTTKLYGLPLDFCQRLNLKVWRNFKESVDASLGLAQTLVSDMIKKGETGDGLIQKLLNDGVSDETVVRLVADFILAAGDTTAYTSIWSLFLLAQDNNIKQEIRTRDVGYVRNVLKESMRLYPVAPFLTRILPQDCILGEYKLSKDKKNGTYLRTNNSTKQDFTYESYDMIWYPEEQRDASSKKKTPIIASLYTSGRDEEYFSNANMFLPYRWDKDDPRQRHLANHNPSASLPFALGARSCIGKKLANLQLTEFITQVVNNFDFVCTNVDKVFPVTSQVLVPSTPVELIISHRRN